MRFFRVPSGGFRISVPLFAVRWREGRGGTPAPPSVFLLSHALDDAGSCGASARLHLFHSIAQFPARQKAVEFPGSVRMAFDGDARGRVSEVNAVVGFIYFLAASPASADKLSSRSCSRMPRASIRSRRAASFSGLTIAGRLQGVDALADRMGQHVPAGGRHGAEADGSG